MKPPGPLLRTVLKAPNLLYRWNVGWLLGHRFRADRAHGAAVGSVLRHGGRSAELGRRIGRGDRHVGLGADSQWYRNIRAGTPSAITFGRDSSAVVHRDITEDEAVAVLRRYEERNRWITPVIRRVLGSLSGLPYDGSEPRLGEPSFERFR